MRKRSDKKGVELSLNTIIIAVIVIVLLVSVISFFLFGFKGLTDRIKGVFYITQAGTDRVFAEQACASYCQNAELLQTATAKLASPYCNKAFYIDGNNDGEADKDSITNEYIEYYCGAKTANAKANVNAKYLNVDCTLKIDDTRTLNNCGK